VGQELASAEMKVTENYEVGQVRARKEEGSRVGEEQTSAQKRGFAFARLRAV
jgi:hypothetical protein